ncbi:MAG: alpha-glucosidase, partial [Firmicutes bacterium]|nr:alpha-glucosidase [Bacillota bacterium]
RLEEKILEAGDHYIEVGLSDVVFFLREGRLLPLAKGGQCVDEVDLEDLTAVSFGEDAVYEYYHDDGVTKNYKDPANWWMLAAQE